MNIFEMLRGISTIKNVYSDYSKLEQSKETIYAVVAEVGGTTEIQTHNNGAYVLRTFVVTVFDNQRDNAVRGRIDKSNVTNIVNSIVSSVSNIDEDCDGHVFVGGVQASFPTRAYADPATHYVSKQLEVSWYVYWSQA